MGLCSPDSKWIVYHSGKQGRRTLWRVSVNGGTPEQLTDYPSICPVVSPDGKWICSYYRPATKARWEIAIIPFNGGPPIKTLEIPANVGLQSLVRWTPDGLSLAYIMNHDGVSNIWTQPVDGGATKQLTDFKSDQIFWFDWSPDAKQLGVSRGNVTSDVVLIRDFRSRERALGRTNTRTSCRLFPAHKRIALDPKPPGLVDPLLSIIDSDSWSRCDS